MHTIKYWFFTVLATYALSDSSCDVGTGHFRIGDYDWENGQVLYQIYNIFDYGNLQIKTYP
jgi:hypothetical protein